MPIYTCGDTPEINGLDGKRIAMKSILYTDDMDDLGKTLICKIQKELSGIEIVTLNSRKSLVQKMSQPLNRISVIIILVSSCEKLERLYSLVFLFENSRIILVLPDREKKTLTTGIRFNPSFFTYPDNKFEDICEVLKKIKVNIQREDKNTEQNKINIF